MQTGLSQSAFPERRLQLPTIERLKIKADSIVEDLANAIDHFKAAIKTEGTADLGMVAEIVYSHFKPSVKRVAVALDKVDRFLDIAEDGNGIMIARERLSPLCQKLLDVDPADNSIENAQQVEELAERVFTFCTVGARLAYNELLVNRIMQAEEKLSPENLKNLKTILTDYERIAALKDSYALDIQHSTLQVSPAVKIKIPYGKIEEIIRNSEDQVLSEHALPPVA